MSRSSEFQTSECNLTFVHYTLYITRKTQLLSLVVLMFLFLRAVRSRGEYYKLAYARYGFGHVHVHGFVLKRIT